jgi:hypothetical protein
MAPQILAVAAAFRNTLPLHATAYPARPARQTLFSAWNLLGCHRISSGERRLAVPHIGSALHHLVTADRLKKTLMGWSELAKRRFRQFPVPEGEGFATVAARLSTKMRGIVDTDDCADPIVRE